MSIQHVVRRKTACIADLSAKGAVSALQWLEPAGNVAMSQRSTSSIRAAAAGTYAAKTPYSARPQLNLVALTSGEFMGVHSSFPSTSKSK